MEKPVDHHVTFSGTVYPLDKISSVGVMTIEHPYPHGELLSWLFAIVGVTSICISPIGCGLNNNQMTGSSSFELAFGVALVFASLWLGNAKKIAVALRMTMTSGEDLTMGGTAEECIAMRNQIISMIDAANLPRVVVDNRQVHFHSKS